MLGLAVGGKLLDVTAVQFPCHALRRPDAFEKHAKVCTPDNPGGPLGMPKSGAAAARAAAAAAATRQPKVGAGGGGSGGAVGSGARGGGGGGNYSARPRAYVCYLCGQQYGSASLLIHVPACYKKWLQVEANKDRKERREPPPPPAELDQPLPTAPEDIDVFNQRMSDIFNGVSLMKCAHCGRTMRCVTHNCASVKWSYAQASLPSQPELQASQGSIPFAAPRMHAYGAGRMRCHVTKSCAQLKPP
jgi:hypothetical protein